MENETQSQGETKKCPKCGEQIQASAKRCKHCQADLRNWFVRHKIITGILALVVIIIIVSVSGGDSEKVNTNNESMENETAQSENKDSTEKEEVKEYKIGDSIKLGEAIVTVNEIEKTTGGQFSKPQAGNEWVNLNITVENTSSSEQYLTTMGQMFLRDAEGNSYQVAVTDKTMESANNSLDGTILANSKRTGWVGFEVKKDVEPLTFQYNGSMWGGKNIKVDLSK